MPYPRAVWRAFIGGAIRFNSVKHRYGRGRDEVTALGPVDLPRTGVDPDELRRSAEYGELRAESGAR